jgi:uncharacterized Zn-binding protein involved in type VI secretion
MSQPAAKQNDLIQAIDIHIVLVPFVSGTTPLPIPHPFNGILDSNLSPDVKIMGFSAATVDSKATNQPPHIPLAPGSFQIPPTNLGRIIMGSQTVLINGKPAARNGDLAQTCADPIPNMAGIVVAIATVFIGG